MQTTFGNLINWKDFQQTEDGTRIFPTEASIRWFIRVNESALVQRKAILKIRGQWYLARPAFDDVFFEIAANKTNLRTSEMG